MKPRSAKAKGRRMVEELKAAILPLFPDFIDPDDIIVLPTSVQGEDWRLSQKVRILWPWATECKNVEKLDMFRAIRQSKANASKINRRPCVVFRRNGHEPWIALQLDSFLQLLKQAFEGKGQSYQGKRV